MVINFPEFCDHASRRVGGGGGHVTSQPSHQPANPVQQFVKKMRWSQFVFKF